ncbi:hypothetical protein OPV22_012461 [Ensete ventricosum]|uniref:Uncharacterized protein n=1 Tax=Ensete ventricosum TaxID=4639 RepID=A0AAV8QX73_ENSVE|nr:hypothetical protein OPV22_012461 [Ensete ventricosum]
MAMIVSHSAPITRNFRCFVKDNGRFDWEVQGGVLEKFIELQVEPQLQEIFKLKHEILLLHKSMRYIGGELLNVGHRIKCIYLGKASQHERVISMMQKDANHVSTDPLKFHIHQIYKMSIRAEVTLKKILFVIVACLPNSSILQLGGQIMDSS